MNNNMIKEEEIKTTKIDINKMIDNVNKFREEVSKKHIISHFMNNKVIQICDNCLDEDIHFYRLDGCKNNMILCSLCKDVLNENICGKNMCPCCKCVINRVYLFEK